MYFYYNDKGVQIWTTNEALAFRRAALYKSAVYQQDVNTPLAITYVNIGKEQVVANTLN